MSTSEHFAIYDVAPQKQERSGAESGQGGQGPGWQGMVQGCGQGVPVRSLPQTSPQECGVM